ncbi:glycosyltransferase family 4 protein [Clostridium botulinum]|nr:glycosyltransferase family 4 protein [Clostridium botulinum]
MLRNIKRILKKNKKIEKVYREINSKVTFNPNICEITPIDARKSIVSEKRLNLLVPSINQEHIFGGISTALKFYEQLAESLGCKRRIITTDAAPSEKDMECFKRYTLINCSQDKKCDYQVVAFNDRYNKTLPIGENDIFISTAWWTAYASHNLIRWQAKEYENEIKKSIYFIQDFEPGFYAWSSQYALADSTYKCELPQIAIFNTGLLKEYFDRNNYKFYQEYSFEPTLNENLKKVLLKFDTFEKKKQILIYGRPSVQRNAFELIIESLKVWVWKQSDYKDWKIYSVGEKHPDVELGNGLKVESLGKLTIDEYANLMVESYVGISLMISPHPSYPPLEMSTFGMKVITNSYANKDISSFNKNIISLDKLNPIEISDALLKINDKYKSKLLNDRSDTLYVQEKQIFEFINEINI